MRSNVNNCIYVSSINFCNGFLVTLETGGRLCQEYHLETECCLRVDKRSVPTFMAVHQVIHLSGCDLSLPNASLAVTGRRHYARDGNQ
jgi:hypothetical protein